MQEILECYFEGREYRQEYLIVKDGNLAGAGAHAYTKAFFSSVLRRFSIWDSGSGDCWRPALKWMTV